MFHRAILTVVLLATVASATDVLPCPGEPAPTSIVISGCTTMPCDIVRGSEMDFVLDFTAQYAAQELRYRVVATALGVTAPYELPAAVANVCNSLVGSACPISAGEDITSTLDMPILPIYPLVSLTLEVSVVDEQDRTQVCFRVDARVVIG